MAGVVMYDGDISGGAIAAVVISGSSAITIPYANGMKVLIVRAA